eukprot:480362-Prorocentrum_lima.AAC.1
MVHHWVVRLASVRRPYDVVHQGQAGMLIHRARWLQALTRSVHAIELLLPPLFPRGALGTPADVTLLALTEPAI